MDPQQIESMIEQGSQFIGINPQNPKGYVVRGIGKLGKGDADGAIVDFRKALELDPDGKAFDAKRYLAGALVYKAKMQPKAPEAPTAVGSLSQPAAVGSAPRLVKPASLKSTSIQLAANITMDMVLIPAGDFDMGRAADCSVGFDDEHPRHFVRITRPFWLAQIPVTVCQWNAIMPDAPKEGSPWRPVDLVPWVSCVEFCRRVASKGFPLRLPTEAEWEYACRAGSSGMFFWGNGEGADEAKPFAFTVEECGKIEPGPEGKLLCMAPTDPPDVGQKRPNPWGQYDISGLVWEWCADWYSNGPYVAERPQDPKGPDTGTRRAVRGGCISEPITRAASHAREAYPPDKPALHVGFRCAMNAS